jgi:hypothetical protein
LAAAQAAQRHKFVCLTDDGNGIHPEVTCLPIPPLNLHLAPGQRDGAWKKLTTFEQDLHGLRGTALFLDLDVVVVGSLDAFFERPGEFLIIHDYARPWRRERITGNSSVYRFELGAHADVLAYFRANMEKVQAEYRNEQAYLSDVLHKQGKLAYWPEAWCPSFKYHGIPTWPTNYWEDAASATHLCCSAGPAGAHAPQHHQRAGPLQRVHRGADPCHSAGSRAPRCAAPPRTPPAAPAACRPGCSRWPRRPIHALAAFA